MENALEMVEEGHLVIAGINAKSCQQAIEKISNFYNLNDQSQIKYALSTILRLVISQKLILGTKMDLELVSEVMVVNDSKQNISLVDSLAKLYLENKITLNKQNLNLKKKI